MIPQSVLMRYVLKLLNTAKSVNTAFPTRSVKSARSKTNVSHTSHSSDKRPFNRKTSFKISKLNNRFNTVGVNQVNTAKGIVVVNAVKGNGFNAVKASACIKPYTWLRSSRSVQIGILTKDFQAPYRQVAPVNVVRMGIIKEFVMNVALKGNRNTQNYGNRATGRAFNVNVNAVEALQDPNVVTECKKVEVGRLIRDCKLELENSVFSINLIPLGHGSFDVIMGMDWLSKNKAVIVCHEKVVEIQLEGSGILRVQGERTLGATKALMNAKTGMLTPFWIMIASIRVVEVVL
nr:putative reverse transcriptase domain-containing protein [Tanacetum cinerariifolium]